MQDSFINKVVAKYNIAYTSKYLAVLLVDRNISLSIEKLDKQRTKLY
jgi:hypothetical protein